MTLVGYGQLEESFKTGSSSYYLFPIKPGERNTLAGTMGELRNTHFHTGIDIRTEGRTGLPVQAAAEGYVSRIAVSSTGYGNAIYITHPNGYITVYGHLEKFIGPLANYVKQEEYRRKTAELNLYFDKNRFKVDKGQLIAYSGNSGSSGGPHLHFDIRDKYNNPVNPLEYGFNEILDHTPPVAQKLVVKTLDKYSRVNDQFGRAEYDLIRIGNNYVINQPIDVYGTIGLELYAYDKLDNSRFRCGINTITMEVDSSKVFQQNIDKLSFAKQRNVLVHMDYAELRETGLRYNKLYVDNGNELDFYSPDSHGKLKFEKSGEKKVHILMKDSYGNVSYLDFKLRFKTPTFKIQGHDINEKTPHLIKNTLVINEPAREKDNSLDLYLPAKKSIAPAYIINNTAIYLWDMKDGLPYSIKNGDHDEVLNYQNMIPPNSEYSFYSKNIDLSFSPHDVFDTLYMQTSYSYDSVNKREIYEIGNSLVPLRSNIAAYLKPEITYSNKDKQAVYALDSYNNLYYQGGTWSGDKIKFYTRDFGKFTIAADSIAPKIIPIKTNANGLMFKITDERSGIKDYTCTVDGEWVLMHYDYKRNLIWSEKLNADENFEGEVKLTLTDNANNKTQYIVNL